MSVVWANVLAIGSCLGAAYTHMISHGVWCYASERPFLPFRRRVRVGVGSVAVVLDGLCTVTLGPAAGWPCQDGPGACFAAAGHAGYGAKIGTYKQYVGYLPDNA